MIIDESVRKTVMSRMTELDDVHQVLVRIEDSIEEEIRGVAADHVPGEEVKW